MSINKNNKKEKEINYNITKYIAFKFMYIGKNYDGLVIQSTTKNTIEEIIFNSLKRCKFLDPSKNNDELMSLSNYSRCGRTDKGVNSSGNVFALNLRYEEKYDYVKTLNNILPNDIFILSSCVVDDSFDPRFRKMQIAANLLCGYHNFRNFCKVDKSDENWEEKNYERRIFEIRIEKVKNEKMIYPFDIRENVINNEYYQSYVCIIKGSAFLWHQVRCIMQILFLIGDELEDIELINEMLNEKSNYEFKYGLADDSNLILSDCVFEFINFNNKEKCDKNYNNCELYIKMEKLYMQNLMQCIINTHFFNVIFNNSFSNLNFENIFKKVNESRKKNRYTKLLHIKTNRMKNEENTKKEKNKKKKQNDNDIKEKEKKE